MHPVLGGLAFGHSLEEEPRALGFGIFCGRRGVPLALGYAGLRQEGVPCLEDVGSFGHVDTGRTGVDIAHGRSPELAQRLGIGAVEGDLDTSYLTHRSA